MYCDLLFANGLVIRTETEEELQEVCGLSREPSKGRLLMLRKQK